MELFANHIVAHAFSLRLLGAALLVALFVLGLRLLVGDDREG